MRKALAFGLGAGAAIQAFRQWPSDGPVSVDAAVVVFLIGLAAAFFGGRSRRPSAAAVAVAQAEARATSVAQNTVQLAVVVPGSRPTAGVGQGVRIPGEGDAAPAWLGPALHQLELDQLDGMDAAELITNDDRAEA